MAKCIICLIKGHVRENNECASSTRLTIFYVGKKDKSDL